MLYHAPARQDEQSDAPHDQPELQIVMVMQESGSLATVLDRSTASTSFIAFAIGGKIQYYMIIF